MTNVIPASEANYRQFMGRRLGPTKEWQRHLLVAVLTIVVQGALYGLNRRMLDRDIPVHLLLANGGVVALALNLPRRYWRTVLVSAVLAGPALVPFVLKISPLGIVLPITAATLELILALYVSSIILGQRRPAIRRPAAGLQLLTALAIICASSATIATIGNNVDTELAASDLNESWIRWFASHLVGLAVMIPLGVAINSPMRWPKRQLVRLEASLACLALLASTVVSFNASFSFVYLVFPCLLWIAIRFGPRLGAPATLGTVVAAAIITANDHGPFALLGSNPTLQVQGFNVAVAYSMVIACALSVQSDADQQQLSSTLDAMPDAAVLVSHTGEVRQLWIPPALEPVASSIRRIVNDRANERPINAASTHIPRRMQTAGGTTFEHRVARVGNFQSLHLLRDITEDLRVQAEVAQQREDIELSRLVEQRRIGEQLHDGPIQELSAALLRIGGALTRAPEPLKRDLEPAETLLAKVIEELRTASSHLIPPDAREGRLVEALEHVGRQLFRDDEIAIDVRDKSEQPPADDEAATLFMIGREALANVAFHAKAEHVTITLGDDDGKATIEVRDDGVGLAAEPDTERRHLGLQLMRNRVDMLGGSLRIRNGEEGGVVITAAIPRAAVPNSPTTTTTTTTD